MERRSYADPTVLTSGGWAATDRSNGRFDRRDLSRMAYTMLTDEKVALYHRVLHGKAWQ